MIVKRFGIWFGCDLNIRIKSGIGCFSSFFFGFLGVGSEPEPGLVLPMWSALRMWSALPMKSEYASLSLLFEFMLSITCDYDRYYERNKFVADIMSTMNLLLFVLHPAGGNENTVFNLVMHEDTLFCFGPG